VDFAFKKLFGSEENSDLLISLINSIVSPENRVARIELKNPYNSKNFGKDKLSILDIKAQDERGRWYNIEMQITDQEYYDRRALYYWSRLYNAQLQEGINYDKLTKTIGINILNFNCLEEKAFHNTYKLLNVETGNEFLDHVEIHFVELEKFQGDISDVLTVLERWIVFLKRAHEFSRSKIPQALAAVDSISRAIKVLDTMALDEEEREVYEARLKWLRDEEMAIKSAHKKGVLEGHMKGLEEGHMKGLEEGHMKGLEEGHMKGLEEGHQKGLEEGHQKGLEEGHQKGLEEGHQKGRQEGREQALADALQRMIDSGISEAHAREILKIGR
jgi:predicted transposase/invertase (TIGR01784 family)